MTGKIERIGVDPTEPAVRNPQLRDLVRVAQQQEVPRLRVDAATIHAAWSERRSQRRRAIGLAAVAAIGLLALGTVVTQRSGHGMLPPDARTIARMTPAPTPADPVVAPAPSPTPDPGPGPAPTPSPMLSDTIAIAALPGAATPSYRVDGRYALALDAGDVQIDVAEGAASPLTVSLPDAGKLEIHVGVTQVQVAGDVVKVNVLEGHAFRITADGTRTELRPQIGSATKPSLGDASKAQPTADELAALAESRLAAGDRPGAIDALRKLVRKYPRSSAARTGLIDLGRLLRAEGKTAEARCAYAEFLERHPRSSLQGEVERALDQLGAGECRGLNPR